MYHIRRRTIGSVALLLTLGVLSGSASSAPLAASESAIDATAIVEEESSAEIAALREEIQLLRAEQKRLEDEIIPLKEQVESVLLQKTYTDQQIALLYREVACYDGLLAIYDSKVTQSDAEYTMLAELGAVHFEVLAARLRQSYEEGVPGILEMLRNADSLIGLLTDLQRRQELEAYDRSLMESVEAEQGHLSQLRSALNQLRTERHQIAIEQVERKQLLNAKIQESGSYLSSLEDSLDRYNYYIQASQAGVQVADRQIAAELAEYLQQLESGGVILPEDEKEQRLALLADTMRGRMEEGILQKGREFYADGAEYIWPLELDDQRTAAIAARMGHRTYFVDGKAITDYHSGMDLSATYGTNVVASASGKVVFVGWQDGYGNCVVIWHGDGIETRYAHLSEITVQAGDYVLQGEKIGAAGCTGNSAGVGCHFELRADGKVMDPADYLVLPDAPQAGESN